MYVKPIFISVRENWHSTAFLKYLSSSVAGLLEHLELVVDARSHGFVRLTRDLHQNISIIELPNKAIALCSSLKKWNWSLAATKDVGIKFGSLGKHTCNVFMALRDYSVTLPETLNAFGVWKNRFSIVESSLTWTNNYNAVNKIKSFSNPSLLELSTIVKFFGQSVLVSSHLHLNYAQLMGKKVWSSFLLTTTITSVLCYLGMGYLKALNTSLPSKSVDS